MKAIWNIIRLVIGFPLMYAGICCMGKSNAKLLVTRLAEDREFVESLSALRKA